MRNMSRYTAVTPVHLPQRGTGVVELDVLTTLADLVEAGPAWQALDASSIADMVYFQSFDWCMAWMCVHAGQEHVPHVIMVRIDGQLMAVWPLMIERQLFGTRILRSLGSPHTQYGNILTATGSLSSPVVQALRNYLAVLKLADSLIVPYVPATSPLVQVLGLATRVSALDNDGTQFDIAGYTTMAAHHQSLPKKRRYARQKTIAALGSIGPLTLHVLHPDDAGFAQALTTSLHQKDEWLANTGRMGSALASGEHETFLARLPKLGTHDGAMVFVLKAGERVVATQVGFLQRGHYYYYLGSFDWSLRQFSPGSLIIEMILEWLAAREVRVFDLLGNPEGFKQRWATRPMALTGHMMNFSMKGALYATLWPRLLRPALKRMYLALPLAARRMLRPGPAMAKDIVTSA
jgi:CelD/BcsL family acetyltransferase involved in cellulose biosynthesis